MTQISLKRWNTWTFRFILKDENGTAIDLNGYKIFLTIKDVFDAVALDTGADYSTSVTVASSVLYHDFTVPHTSTAILPWLYHYWYRWIVPVTLKQYTSDSTFTVEETTTNRLT